MEWGNKLCATSEKFQSQHNTYCQAINHLENRYNLQKCRPQSIPVELLGDKMVLNVITFDIPAMLESLINDINLNKYENLVVNPYNWFGNMNLLMVDLEKLTAANGTKMHIIIASIIQKQIFYVL